jgi:hemolysin activation/secretion protein
MRTRLLIQTLLLAGVIGAALPSFAQEAPVQDPADRLLREKQEKDRLDRLQQDTPEIALSKEAAVDSNAAPESIADPEPAFAIERVVVAGNTLLPQARIDTVTRPFAGIRLGINRINLLLKRLTQAYVDAGYITTRVYVGEQNLAAGTLTLTVIPGTVERLNVNGKDMSFGEDLALPLKHGAVLKLQDLEQGIDQLNRLQRNHAQVEIQPGQQAGGSVVAISNTPGDRLYYTLGLDNFGDKATGETRIRAGIEADNILGLQEALSLTYNGSLDTNALLFAGALPYGYNTYSYTYSYSEFQNLIGDTALVFGRSEGHTLAWNRILSRSRLGKSALDATLSLREAEREINNIELAPQNLAVLRLAYNRFRRFDMGAVPGLWTIDVGYSRGLDAMGASNDPEDLPEEGAHAQFDKLDASANVSFQFSPAWSYRTGLRAQYAKEALFGSEQLFAGGPSSVRGFKESALAGDRGFTVRNELGYTQLPLWAKGKLRLEPFAFLDGGRTYLIAERTWRSIAGAGLGVRAGYKGLSAEFLFGKSIHVPAFVDTDFRIQASLNLSF